MIMYIFFKKKETQNYIYSLNKVSIFMDTNNNIFIHAIVILYIKKNMNQKFYGI